MDKNYKMISIHEVNDFAEKYNQKLRSDDPRFRNFVIVQCKFGFPRAQFIYPNAFAVQYTGGNYIVFTEHYGWHQYHADEHTVLYLTSTSDIPKVKRVKTK